MHEQRKADHLKINLEEDVRFPHLTNGFEHYRFVHQALPQLDLERIDTSVQLFGRSLKTPLLISSMTGGTAAAEQINLNLAAAAQACGMAMGLGSQRAGIERPELVDSYRVRRIAPDILLMANLGAVQLNYRYNVEQCRRAVDMIEADALILHLNPLQEALQTDGNWNWAGLVSKIEQVCQALAADHIPVIAKEVGWGISEQAARQLKDAGISAIDVAGSGGTSWSEVEMHRAPTEARRNLARAFADWGIPTAESLIMTQQGAPGMLMFASGGMRTGIECAKALALGASLCGLAGPMLKAAALSAQATADAVNLLTDEIRIAMFCAGAGNLAALRDQGRLIRI